MVSQRKIAANRRNAQRSTGPKTPAGKAAVRHNALKHGLLAKEVVISSGDGKESQAEFDCLLSALVKDLQPVGISEELLVQRIALCQWRLRRAVRYETAEIRRSHGVPRSDDSEPEPSTSLLSLLASVPTLAAVLAEARWLWSARRLALTTSSNSWATRTSRSSFTAIS